MHVANRRIKRYSKMIREKKTKTTMKYYFASVIMVIIKRTQITNVDENVTWCSHCGKEYKSFLETKNGTAM